MPFDRFLIAPLSTGLETDLRPWLIPDDAFEQLNNAYVFRGRVRKRFGSMLMGFTQQTSRLRVNIGTTDGAGNFGPFTVPGDQFNIGQLFTIGNTFLTVYQVGAMLTTGLATGTYSGAGLVTITGNGENPNTAVYWYPALPVMGLTNYELGPINNQPSFAFDEEFAYLWNAAWNRSVDNILGLNPVFHGGNLNFFWTANWDGITSSATVLFVTNNYIVNVTGSNSPSGLGSINDDPIWTYNQFPQGGLPTWYPFSYQPDPTFVFNPNNYQPLTVTRTTKGNNQIIANYVQSARIIAVFKDRLVLLNTIENNALGATAFNPAMPQTTGITPATYITSTNTQYKNRCRYSHNGSPFATNAWLEPNQTYNPGATGVVIADGGGFIDAPTEEQIISAEFIKDRLIVFFERSTWELAYTQNQIVPFVWQKINTELGAESTFSTVPFDKQILTVGNTGIHACNGSNVERIDNKIPDQVFEIEDKNEGVKRVAGIRDYFVEMVYWTFPPSDTTFTFPNQVLVYNYKNGAWALNNDVFTCFGYFEQQTDITWQEATFTWEETDNQWNSGVVQAQFRQVIAGNQEGFVLIIAPDQARNAPSMQITNLVITSNAVITLTVVDHTLLPGEYVAVENVQGIVIAGIFLVIATPNTNTIVLQAENITGSYLGGGTIARVSNIQILSKEWNPYVANDRNVFLHRIDFGVQATAAGEVTVDYYPSSTTLSMITAGEISGSILGNSVLEMFPYALYPLEQFEARLWHPVYFQTSGHSIQIFISLSAEQITQPAIAWSDFELEGMILYTRPTSYRLE